jgi:hypothetical protein
MKPLRSAPQTREDIAIWDRVVERHDGQGIAYSAASITADRRDAALMSWLTQAGVRHYAGLDIPPEMRIPLVHLWVRGAADWPVGHHLIELT